MNTINDVYNIIFNITTTIKGESSLIYEKANAFCLHYYIYWFQSYGLFRKYCIIITITS